MANTNFKDTYCSHCEARVPAYEGTYEYGATYCADTAACEARKAASDQRMMRLQSERSRIQNDRNFVPTFPENVKYREDYWRLVDERANDPKAIAAAKRRAAEDAALAAQGLKRCQRCGGAGRSESWAATGYACYDCNGKGSVLA